MKVRLCHAEAETACVGARLARNLYPGDTVLLYGPMGAGKSVLARAIACGLGITEPMPSPTFLLMLPYATTTGLVIYHMDLYRLDGEAAFFAAGLDECLADGISLIEWPERCPRAYKQSRRIIAVHIAYRGHEDERSIIINIHNNKHSLLNI